MRAIHLLAVMVSAPLLSVPALASPNDEEAVAVDPKDKLVCKRQQATGTRFFKKICKTAAQWDALAEQHRRDLREAIDRPQIEIRRN
ncbi:hypothetical protein BWQ93_14505 [Sphingopyxis sp. QXT-31]|uniref:hypothetical protein n=1 Tax=Sphingopyxis sp. QXT-31 TaxID=1357916 RepID=UPI0009794526|nr:hypothetical protein [Sphingopyxis sp. QXT-31]APZ99560.1 hypothetical protein BWQ93_14505 [Sphingopyxis sp. QXT-31]